MSNYYGICLKLPLVFLGSCSFVWWLNHCIKLLKRKGVYSIENLELEMQRQCQKYSKNLAIIYNQTIEGVVQTYPNERLITKSNQYFYYHKKTYGYDYLWDNLTLIKEKKHLEQSFYLQDQGIKQVLVTIKHGHPLFYTTYEKSKFKKNQKEANRNWLYKALLNPYITFYKTKNSLRFNQNIFLSGNFIYNHQTGMIRCFQVKQISIKNDFNSNFETIANLLMLVAFGYVLYCWIVDVYKAIEKRLCQNTQIQKCGYFCLQCQNNRSNIIAFPCGHISICQQCQVNTRKCPKCQQAIKASQLIYQV